MPRRRTRNKQQHLPTWVKEATNDYKAYTESLCAFIREHDVPTDGHRNFDRAALKVLDVLTSPIPQAIFVILDKAIETRDRVSQYFTEQKKDAGIDPSDSDYDHRSFTDKLRNVRRVWSESQQSTSLEPEQVSPNQEHHISQDEDMTRLDAAVGALNLEVQQDIVELTPLFAPITITDNPYVFEIDVPSRSLRLWQPDHRLWVSWGHVEHISEIKDELGAYLFEEIPVEVSLTDSKGQYWLFRWQIYSFARLEAEWDHYERHRTSSALMFPDPRSIDVDPQSDPDFIDYCESKEGLHMQWCSTPSKSPAAAGSTKRRLTREWWEILNCDAPSKRRYLMHTYFSASEDDTYDYVSFWREGDEEYLNCTTKEARKILKLLYARCESASYWHGDDPIPLEFDDRYFFERPESAGDGVADLATSTDRWDSLDAMWPEHASDCGCDGNGRVSDGNPADGNPAGGPRAQELQLMDYFVASTANQDSHRYGY